MPEPLMWLIVALVIAAFALSAVPAAQRVPFFAFAFYAALGTLFVAMLVFRLGDGEDTAAIEPTPTYDTGGYPLPDDDYCYPTPTTADLATTVAGGFGDDPFEKCED